MGTSPHRLACAVAWGQYLSRASLVPSLSCKGPARMAVRGLDEGKGPGVRLCTSVHGSSDSTERGRGLEQGRRSWGCNTGR